MKAGSERSSCVQAKVERTTVRSGHLEKKKCMDAVG